MATTQVDTKRKQRNYPLLWGYSVTRICYRLGQLGWNAASAKVALEELIGCEIRLATIGTGVTDGKNPTYEKSNAAPLTGLQIEVLSRAVGLAPANVHIPVRAPLCYPDELTDFETIYEGATKTVAVNAYERDPKARRLCIAAHGSICTICKFNFVDKYGEVANGFIHVHLLRPLSEHGGEHIVDPIADLRPVCPNCHAVLHLNMPAYTIEQVKNFIGSKSD